MRLQRAIANAGITSRRGAEELIQLGLVKVNGKRTTDPAANVDIEKDTITVDGKRMKKPQNNCKQGNGNRNFAYSDCRY